MTLLRSTPLRARSDKQAARDRELGRARPALKARCRNRCELCGADLYRVAADVHHPFGRHQLGVWTNHPDCLTVVCRPCHERVTNPIGRADHELAETAQTQVLMRLAHRAGARRPSYSGLRVEVLRLLALLGDPPEDMR